MIKLTTVLAALYVASWAGPAGAQIVTIVEQKTAFDAPLFATSDSLMNEINTEPTLYGWLNRLQAFKPTTQAEVDRIGREYEAGRAEAVVMFSRLLERLPDGKEDCENILKLLQRAKALGSARADYLLGTFFANKDCGEGRRELALPAFLDAVKRDNAFAALDLSKIYANGPRKLQDPALAYVYAQFAAQRLATLDEKLPPALQPQPDALKAKLSKKELQRAAAVLTDLDGKASEHRARMKKSFSARVLGLPESAVNPPGWTVIFWQIDHTGECFDNLIGNCRGVPRNIAGRLSNVSPHHLFCTLTVTLPEFAGGDALNTEYRLIAAPNARRAVFLGVSPAEVPASGAFRVNCATIELNAKNVCETHLSGDSRADSFYPPTLAASGVTGTTTVQVLAMKSGGLPEDVIVSRSSGNVNLDQAALKAVRSRKFDLHCKGTLGIATVSVAFAR